MMTEQTFREVFEMGMEYAEIIHERESGGLFHPGNCTFDGGVPTDKYIEKQYREYIGEESFSKIPPESYVYAYQGPISQPPAIRAYSAFKGRDRLANEFSPPGIKVTAIGSLTEVLRNPDQRLPQTWIGSITDKRFGDVSDTIYDRLEPADDVEARIPDDVTLTVGDDEYEITDLDYDLTRCGDTLEFKPTEMKARSNHRLAIDFE